MGVVAATRAWAGAACVVLTVAACTGDPGRERIVLANHRGDEALAVSLPPGTPEPSPAATLSHSVRLDSAVEIAEPGERPGPQAVLVEHRRLADGSELSLGTYEPVERPVSLTGLGPELGPAAGAVADTLVEQRLAGAPALALRCTALGSGSGTRVVDVVLVSTFAGVAVLQWSGDVPTREPGAAWGEVLASVELLSASAGFYGDWIDRTPPDAGEAGSRFSCGHADLASLSGPVATPSGDPDRE